MEKFIKVYDDLIPPYIQDYLEFLLTQNSGFKWYFMGNLTGDENSTNEEGFGSTVRKKQSEFALEPSLVTTNYDALVTPLHIFCNTQKFIVNSIDFARAYFQLPSINPKIQYPHTDQDNPHYVFLYYVNDSDGDTVFYDNDMVTEIKRVSPKKGRIAFFNGLIPHSGSSPSKRKRAVININFHFQDLSNFSI